MVIPLLFFLLLCTPSLARQRRTPAGSLYWLTTTGGTLSVLQSLVPPTDVDRVLASLEYNRSYSTRGWDYLHVRAEEQPYAGIGLEESFFYGGYLEGYVTADTIQYFLSYLNGFDGESAAVKTWVSYHMAYLETESAARKGESAYWRQVAALLQQMRGIAAGLKAKNVNLTYEDIFHFNFRFELSDVERATSSSVSLEGHTSGRRDAARSPSERQHCSALIKVTPTQIFSSHITWTGYLNMIRRQYKIYEFNLRVAMSGYPAQIHSGDDWYLTSNKLATQETTNDYYYPQLARKFVKPNSVSEFLRVMVANFLSYTGREWVKYFTTNHSGTYCNQYMVIDYKRYTSGDTGYNLRDDLLWVVEEMPGYYEYRDATPVLRATGYWASFNVPYFKTVYNASGFQMMYDKYGDLFSYTQYARPRIFKRDHDNVDSLETMKHMMQYNAFKTDPFSLITNCSACVPPYAPELSIASRGDLQVPNATLGVPSAVKGFYARTLFGAIDAKITTSNFMTVAPRREYGTVFNGPTPQQPLFSWSGYGSKAPPNSPDLYNYSWEVFSN